VAVLQVLKPNKRAHFYNLSNAIIAQSDYSLIDLSGSANLHARLETLEPAKSESDLATNADLN
jgi:hypothetical protein